MKPVNRNISLLLTCGLMLPLCGKHTDNGIGKKSSAPACQEKKQPVKTPDCQTGENSFSFFRDVLSNMTPALKNLK